MIVTLYSPGPFSGTPSFDLPELPLTVIVKTGNPLVGNEEIDGVSFFTQRHEFRLFTQRSGEVVVSPFGVRFFGKRTFIAKPEAVEGFTPELRWESKRPPGAGGLGLVLSATSLEIEQRWNPDPVVTVEAGDVVVRTITRKAEGTSAMLLPSVSTNGPAGVRVYVEPPTVLDRSERGQFVAERSDTVKYQFVESGTFTLPGLTFVWWDPEQGELRRENAAGIGVAVAAVSPIVSGGDGAGAGRRVGPWTPVLAGLFGLGGVAWLFRGRLDRRLAAWRAMSSRPEAVAAHKLRRACADNDASAAYAALMAWMAARRTAGGWPVEGAVLAVVEHRQLSEAWRELSRRLYAASRPVEPWRGGSLWAAFVRSRRQLDRRAPGSGSSILPKLNPGPAPCGLAFHR